VFLKTPDVLIFGSIQVLLEDLENSKFNVLTKEVIYEIRGGYLS
jgi:hypothetical protein